MFERFIFPMITETESRLPVFMYGTGFLSNQYGINRQQGHPIFQWIQSTGGEGALVSDGKTYTVKAGQGMFLYPNQPHSYYPVKEPWEVYWIMLGGNEVERLAKLGGLDKSGVYDISQSEILVNNLKNAYSIANTGNSLAGLECAKLTYSLMLDIIRYTSQSAKSIDQNHIRLQPVIDYIDRNYATVIQLSDLANILGMTSQHLCMLFRNLVKTRPIEYVNIVRISKSKELMYRRREMRIGEISRQVGFQNPGYFCKIFKRYEGVTPEAFKELNGL
jgi:AraC family transcriptional regulator of arabinose operon